MLNSFFLVFSYLGYSIVLAFGLFFLLRFLLIFPKVDSEKLSAYECGFNPFEDVYGRFDVRFYLVAILFLIFDLEVTFIFPWSSNIVWSHLFGFAVMLFFLVILTLGFLYEWKRGALDWQ